MVKVPKYFYALFAVFIPYYSVQKNAWNVIIRWLSSTHSKFMQMHQLSVGRYIESNGKLVTVHKMKCAFVAVSKTVHEVHW